MQRTFFITSERMGFGRWERDDLPLACALWGDARVTALIGGPFTEAHVAARLEKEIATQAEFGVQYWPTFLLDDGQHVGCAGLRPYRVDERVYELGFHLRPEHWGRGLAKEAARAVIKFAFENLGASALFAGHHPENGASRQLLEKLGFRRTGEEFYEPTGFKHPSYLLHPGLE